MREHLRDVVARQLRDPYVTADDVLHAIAAHYFGATHIDLSDWSGVVACGFAGGYTLLPAPEERSDG